MSAAERAIAPPLLPPAEATTHSADPIDPPGPTDPPLPPGPTGPTGPRRGRWRRLPASRHRLYVLADQGASSLSNVVVTILVANGSSRGTFGAFAVAMVAYQLAAGGIRSVAGEPLLSLYADQGPTARRRIVSDIHGTTLFLSVACSALLAAVSPVVGGEPGAALLVLAYVLPLVVLQDTWRYLFIIDRPGVALTIDMVWLVAVLAFAPLVPVGAPVGQYVLAWGLAGGLGAIVGTALGWGLPGWPHPWKWLVNHRDVCGRYFTEFVVANGVTHAGFVALAVISGAAALGAARAAWVIFGPLAVMHQGLYLLLVPEGARSRGDLGGLRKKFVLASAVCMGLTLAWLALTLVVPSDWGEVLFSDTWAKAEPLLLPMGVAMTAGGALIGALLGLRSLADARRSLRARLWSTPVLVVAPVGGAFLAGAPGFVLGYAAANATAAAIWWVMFELASRHPSTGEGAGTPAAVVT